MPEPAPPRVFISYSHDSDEHRDLVLDLAGRLRRDGIDAIIDQYVQSPPEGWPAWCEAEIRRARFVLMICTEIYLRRVSGEEEPGKGHGVLREARLIRQHLYDAGSVSTKFVPVLFADGSHDHVPTPVKGASIGSSRTKDTRACIGFSPTSRACLSPSWENCYSCRSGSECRSEKLRPGPRPGSKRDRSLQSPDQVTQLFRELVPSIGAEIRN